jgi:thiosulfate/3-mercaptopyruvate sulfurtransferase
MLPPVVDAAWVQARQDRLVLADVRWYLDGRDGRPAYEAGHVPGAVWVDLDRWLSDHDAPPTEGRHPLPTPEHFARGMGETGIAAGDEVVAYDDQGGVVAARLVWMLRATGHSAALLDGGIEAWPGALETGTTQRAPAAFAPVQWPGDRLATIDDAADRANVVIDARQRERFLGGPDALDPRAGHIPGARSVPAREHLDDGGRLKPQEDLRARFAQAGVVPGAPVVSYCGSGVSACHNLLVMEHAGIDGGRLYPGSWSQWSRTPERPIATEEDA